MTRQWSTCFLEADIMRVYAADVHVLFCVSDQNDAGSAALWSRAGTGVWCLQKRYDGDGNAYR